MKTISAFVTTFNNEKTLANCLKSVQWADEIVVLDSYSTDSTVSIAESYGAKIFQHEFLGYGPQKQSALEKISCEWALLLDADEEVTPALAKEIQGMLTTESGHDGYKLPRQEQLFWVMSSPYSGFNYQLRLFRRLAGALSDDAVHADPEVHGTVGQMRHPFYHYGEVNIHAKEARINAYSSGMVEEKVAKGKKHPLLMCLFYPAWTFLQSYVFKRGFLNGSAGFIGSVIMAHYAFLKYAKLHEYYQVEKYGTSLLPADAPDNLAPPKVPK
ncbi:glycosyltransferase family 2 protein [Desulfotalea psychrophila]|uniref:Related to lipopolysaccharide core biosynthesis glycosyl transferase (KdtX) n=1 Tax=Desulfotalea psychrophila (strain LSv54 / DSM 12343) TaxID=177439 RepID=Q6AL27_DESPS|nr:glycosyltransferase family 2 protein [Desulfotalea psychrophila]CAG36948.1 related to lipopolysaccharide core biosynthesis glycosyl transferase (KdtX) [Desulfotalea psychrophila LSv54]